MPLSTLCTAKDTKILIDQLRLYGFSENEIDLILSDFNKISFLRNIMSKIPEGLTPDKDRNLFHNTLVSANNFFRLMVQLRAKKDA